MDPRVPRVITTMFAQGGKTSGAFNVIGAVLDSRPVPIMFVASTQDQILRVIEPKIDDMLRNCASLWAKTIQGQAYTGTRKVIAGVALRLAWPTPSQMSSDSVGLVLVDEIDRINRDIRGEGGIIELADARHNTYANGKTVGFSTPTEGNVEAEIDPRTGLEHWRVADVEQVISPVWSLWQMGTRHEWSWPCPECMEYFIPRSTLLSLDRASTLNEIRSSTVLPCPHCGAAIPSGRKRWMNARGVYVAPGQRPVRHELNAKGAEIEDHTGAEPVTHRVDFGSYELPAGYTGEDATFWVSGIANFSAKKTFGALAVELVKAERSGDIEKVRGVINLQYGEVFRFSGEAPAWREVAARKLDYHSGTIPEGVRVLFLTVDVGARKLDYVVRGWGADRESWLIEQGEIWGETNKPEVWTELDELLEREWGGMKIERTAIDAGFLPNEVYGFCKFDREGRARRHCIATRGGDHEKLFRAAKIEVDRRGKLKPYSFILWHVDHDRSKQWVHARMALEPEQQGQWHLPGDTDEDYCRQIVAEQRVPTPAGRFMWKRTGANHKLDCEALQYVLSDKEAAIIRRRVRAARSVPADAQEDVRVTPTRAPPAARPRAARRPGTSWARGWRK